MMAEGVVLSASAGEHATASYRWEPLLGGSHDPAGGTPLRGAGRVCWGFCVRGVLCVGDGVSSFFANLHLGLGGACGSLALRVGGRRVTCSACRWPAVHWFCVSRAGGPLACRVAGLRSTGSGCRGPAGHPDLSNTNMTLCKLGASLVDHGPSPTTRVATGSRRIPGTAVAPSPCGDPHRPEE